MGAGRGPVRNARIEVLNGLMEVRNGLSELANVRMRIANVRMQRANVPMPLAHVKMRRTFVKLRRAFGRCTLPLGRRIRHDGAGMRQPSTPNGGTGDSPRSEDRRPLFFTQHQRDLTKVAILRVRSSSSFAVNVVAEAETSATNSLVTSNWLALYKLGSCSFCSGVLS